MTAPKFSVKVPATSANLGPGFDCLGIALELHNELTVYCEEPFAIELQGASLQSLPLDRSNTVVQAMDKLFDFVSVQAVPRDFRLVLDNHIPIAAGLGSSASAIVGGLMLANAMVAHYEPNRQVTQREILALATEMEGHPDNVSPAIYGGASLTWMDTNAELRYIPIPLPDSLYFVVATPYFPLLTEKSRYVVPLTVSRGDAVYNIAQTARLMIALTTNQLDLLRGGFGDKLHEPYRRPLIPGCQEVQRAAVRAGALTTTLSGAGPSLLAWSDSETLAWKIADEMTLTWRELGIPCDTDVFRAWMQPTEVVPLFLANNNTD